MSLVECSIMEKNVNALLLKILLSPTQEDVVIKFNNREEKVLNQSSLYVPKEKILKVSE